MADVLKNVLAQLDGRRAQTLDGLKQFLRFPSISTQPDHAKDLVACAEWLAKQIGAAGFDVSVRETGGHPAVVAHSRRKVAGAPTVLLYGHYDVQPPEPLDEWKTPPFEPTVRKDAAGFDAIFARGACDDKGQVWAHVAALTAWRENGGAPVNIKLLIEGEEEIGSDHLDKFVAANKTELAADVVVISDTGQFARGVPAITYGLRGLCYMEIELVGPAHDLHSGLFGGAVPNPANVLASVLASLHDAQGRVNIPGFYDDVRALTQAERDAWKALPFDEAVFMASLKLSVGTGEAGFTNIERRWGRPTLDVNGITSGYQGHGAKTVIPSKASAKVSMRLVPDQDPAKIQAAFERTIRERCPANVQVTFKQHGLSAAVLVSADSPAMKLAWRAVETGFGAAPTLMRDGGSIPVVGLFQRELGVDSLLVGFGLPDDRVHSPNEKFDLAALHSGTRTAAALYHELASLPSGN